MNSSALNYLFIIYPGRWKLTFVCHSKVDCGQLLRWVCILLCKFCAERDIPLTDMCWLILIILLFYPIYSDHISYWIWIVPSNLWCILCVLVFISVSASDKISKLPVACGDQNTIGLVPFGKRKSYIFCPHWIPATLLHITQIMVHNKPVCIWVIFFLPFSYNYDVLPKISMLIIQGPVNIYVGQ